jgi:hypothetical protein
MTPLDCYADGMYFTAGCYYVLESLAVVPEPPVVIKPASASGGGISIHPFRLQTEHGEFRWAVEVLDYSIPAVKVIKGYSMTDAPEGTIVMEQLHFTLSPSF